MKMYQKQKPKQLRGRMREKEREYRECKSWRDRRVEGGESQPSECVR